MNSIYEYIFNDVKEIFTGKINTSKENSNYYDIIDSPSCKVKDSNLIMIPKLIINKNNKRNHFNELIDVAYNKLKIKYFMIKIIIIIIFSFIYILLIII